MGHTVATPVQAARSAVLALAGTAALVGLASWLVLAGRGRWAGTAAAGAGLLLLAVAQQAAADRAFDGCILSAIALAVRDVDPPAAAVAVAALVAGFLAAYVRARGRALGYGVEDSFVTRAVRYGLVAVGLAGDWLGPTMIALLVVTCLAAVVRASQVAKQERE